MAKLEVWPLETDGFAIVTVERAEQLRLEFEPYVDIEETATWGDFRRAGHPFELASEIVDRAAGVDVSEYIRAVESANGLEEGAATLEERWVRVCGLPVGPSPDSDVPSDEDEFEYQHGEYGAQLGWSIALQAWMLDDLPDEVLDEFGLGYDSTLDGALGLVPSEQLDAVRSRLIELGFEIE